MTLQFSAPYQIDPNRNPEQEGLDRISQALGNISGTTDRWVQEDRQKKLQDLQMQLLKSKEARDAEKWGLDKPLEYGNGGIPTGPNQNMTMGQPISPSPFGGGVPEGPGQNMTPDVSQPQVGGMIEKFRQWQSQNRSGQAMPQSQGGFPGIPGYTPEQVNTAYSLGTKRTDQMTKLFPKEKPEAVDSLEKVLVKKVLAGEMTLEQATEMKRKSSPNPNMPPQGKMLPAPTVLTLNEGKNVARMMPDVEAAIKANLGKYGPVTGRLSTMNPYDTGAQTFDARMRTASQAFGRFMEGGVLRKEDEAKYLKMFPQAQDKDDVKVNKLSIVRRTLAQKYEDDKNTLGSSGYDVSGFGTLEIPPSIFENGGGQGGGQPQTVQRMGKDGKMYTYTLNPRTGKYE